MVESVHQHVLKAPLYIGAHLRRGPMVALAKLADVLIVAAAQALVPVPVTV